ncbi:hypothetical protein GOBAR_DD03051 [Gossypium barbadense]|nr:hypothetical protein GOBAR_DD03051 [Gossypium barbadense]
MNDLHLSFDANPPKSSNRHRLQRSLEVGGFDSPWVLCLHISSYLKSNLIGGVVIIQNDNGTHFLAEYYKIIMLEIVSLC